jgi:hypothetical protein
VVTACPMAVTASSSHSSQRLLWHIHKFIYLHRVLALFPAGGPFLPSLSVNLYIYKYIGNLVLGR